MYLDLFVPEKSIGDNRFRMLNKQAWPNLKEPLSLFEALLKTGIDIRLKTLGSYWCIYAQELDGEYQEEVLDLLKEYRPELYYEIMLGIKQ